MKYERNGGRPANVGEKVTLTVGNRHTPGNGLPLYVRAHSGREPVEIIDGMIFRGAWFAEYEVRLEGPLSGTSMGIDFFKPGTDIRRRPSDGAKLKVVRA